MSCENGRARCVDPDAFSYVVRQAVEHPLVTMMVVMVAAAVVTACLRYRRRAVSGAVGAAAGAEGSGAARHE